MYTAQRYVSCWRDVTRLLTNAERGNDTVRCWSSAGLPGCSSEHKERLSWGQTWICKILRGMDTTRVEALRFFISAFFIGRPRWNFLPPISWKIHNAYYKHDVKKKTTYKHSTTLVLLMKNTNKAYGMSAMPRFLESLISSFFVLFYPCTGKWKTTALQSCSSTLQPVHHPMWLLSMTSETRHPHSV